MGQLQNRETSLEATVEIQRRNCGDLGQNGGIGVVNSGQTLVVGSVEFAVGEIWCVRKKRRVKNITKVF